LPSLSWSSKPRQATPRSHMVQVSAGMSGAQPEKPLVARLDVVPEPDATNTADADVHAGQAELVGDPLRSVGGERERAVEDAFLHLLGHAVGVGAARASLPLEQRLDASDLEGALDLVEGVAVVAHNAARLATLPSSLSELEQGQLSSGALWQGHSGSLLGLFVCLATANLTQRTEWPAYAFSALVSEKYATTSGRPSRRCCPGRAGDESVAQRAVSARAHGLNGGIDRIDRPVAVGRYGSTSGPPA